MPCGLCSISPSGDTKLAALQGQNSWAFTAFHGCCSFPVLLLCIVLNPCVKRNETSWYPGGQCWVWPVAEGRGRRWAGPWTRGQHRQYISAVTTGSSMCLDPHTAPETQEAAAFTPFTGDKRPQRGRGRWVRGQEQQPHSSGYP